MWADPDIAHDRYVQLHGSSTSGCWLHDRGT
jgi:hypothetical protein